MAVKEGQDDGPDDVQSLSVARPSRRICGRNEKGFVAEGLVTRVLQQHAIAANVHEPHQVVVAFQCLFSASFELSPCETLLRELVVGEVTKRLCEIQKRCARSVNVVDTQLGTRLGAAIEIHRRLDASRVARQRSGDPAVRMAHDGSTRHVQALKEPLTRLGVQLPELRHRECDIRSAALRKPAQVSRDVISIAGCATLWPALVGVGYDSSTRENREQGLSRMVKSGDNIAVTHDLFNDRCVQEAARLVAMGEDHDRKPCR